MQHHRSVAFTVLSDVAGIQAFRQNEVCLQCPALPFPPDRIPQYKLQLRTIKCALAQVHVHFNASGFRRVHQRFLGTVPDLILSGTNFRTVGKLDREIVESEIPIYG